MKKLLPHRSHARTTIVSSIAIFLFTAIVSYEDAARAADTVYLGTSGQTAIQVDLGAIYDSTATSSPQPAGILRKSNSGERELLIPNLDGVGRSKIRAAKRLQLPILRGQNAIVLKATKFNDFKEYTKPTQTERIVLRSDKAKPRTPKSPSFKLSQPKMPAVKREPIHSRVVAPPPPTPEPKDSLVLKQTEKKDATVRNLKKSQAPQIKRDLDQQTIKSDKLRKNGSIKRRKENKQPASTKMKEQKTSPQDASSKSPASEAANLAKNAKKVFQNTDKTLVAKSKRQSPTIIEPKRMAALTADSGPLQIRFRQGSTSLTSIEKNKLRELLELTLDSKKRLQLKAYAANDGTTSSKARRLSLSRALAVRAYLIEKGIRSTRIDVRALGTPRDNGPSDRVDIMILDR